MGAAAAAAAAAAAVALAPTRVQLFSFSLYDDDNKGYITKEDLDRCAPLLRFAARISLSP